MDLLIPGFGLMIWTLISFIILIIILKKFAWKPILTLLNEREAKIQDSIQSADKIRLEVASMKNENEALLQKAKDEKANIIKEARVQSEKIISDAKHQAKIEFDRIVSEAQQTIIQQKNAAIIDIKNKAGNLVVELSEKVLRRELQQKKEQEKFVDELIDVVSFD
ncbi:MAG: F0F1 ATP synthase subunit B [Sediminibacterium sp.]|nr:F0F1 ATP synthase subunit B [Sediminibacterium sp.]